ncbi:MAG: ABC-2 family transporter protein, partial [Candidatus Woesearchaeota archaeon]|nr:ABC-2 family transporter protein [Candidatus Woesearchaeota archaeon]
MRYFIQSFKMALGSEIAYRFNFVLRTLTLISFDLIMPFITLVIYMSTKGFPGWTIEQMILFQGIFIFINAIDRLFFQQVDWSLSHMVRSGEFDRVLLYPVNVLACLSFSNLGISHLANMIIGIVAIIY